MGIRRWWNDSDREKLKYLGEENCPIAIFSPKNPHGLPWD
jgi:hypothetical protein